MAGGFVFFATGSRLLKLDASTGAVVAEAPLADGTAYGCRPIYAKGLVVVPLNNGRLQALSALTLQTRWLTEALPAAVQEVASGSEGGAASVTYDRRGFHPHREQATTCTPSPAAADLVANLRGLGAVRERKHRRHPLDEAERRCWLLLVGSGFSGRLPSGGRGRWRAAEPFRLLRQTESRRRLSRWVPPCVRPW